VYVQIANSFTLLNFALSHTMPPFILPQKSHKPSHLWFFSILAAA